MSVTSGARDLDTQAKLLRRYHEYLNKNYTCGVERFFSPTGSLEKFQRYMKVSAQRTRDYVYARDVDDAALKLVPAVSGCDGVFDLAAEPGSGKTSQLPFKFETKKVVVAMPTPFDAWNAFQMATGGCHLKLKGLHLGDPDASVCYTDSYLASNMVLSGYMDYDILIVDECDSGKGVTRFLSDVKVKGKLVIRMSASHGRTTSGPSRAFEVAEDSSLPDVRNGVREFADAVRPKLGNRSLVLLPDAQAAIEVASHFPGAELVTAQSGLESLAKCIVDQEREALFVSDDVCGRGLNLNLDVVVDSQLVTEHGVTRNLTAAELYQRKGRVGRNRPGWYISPGLPTIALRESEADVLRSNVLRSLAGIEQHGPTERHVSVREAEGLVYSSVEPITVHKFKGEVVAAPVSAPRSTTRSRSSSSKSLSPVSSPKLTKSKVSTPGWMSWLSGATDVIGGKSYYVSEDVVYRQVAKQPVRQPPRTSRDLVDSFHRLAIAPEAPYASPAAPKLPEPRAALALPSVPPTVDLTELQYQMDWPSAIRDCVERGMDLPTIVPPGNWRHTSTGGMATDWYARLDRLAETEYSFVESEFEVVCRAWNKLVASTWVRKTPGLASTEMDESRLEFCVRYFQSYYMMLSL